MVASHVPALKSFDAIGADGVGERVDHPARVGEADGPGVVDVESHDFDQVIVQLQVS